MRGNRRRSCCQISLASGLKLLNYLLSFVGISIVFYSVWMLNYWNNHYVIPSFPPPVSAPSSDAPPYAMVSGSRAPMVAYGRWSFESGIALGFGNEDALRFALSCFCLPVSWFIYSFMGVGIVLCNISFIGCIATKAINGCCLCFYAILVSLLLLVDDTTHVTNTDRLIEANLASVIILKNCLHSSTDLPFDPTGELDSLRSFIDVNADIFKWIGTAVLVIRWLSLLFTFVLRGLASPRHTDYCEDDYDGRARIREPLLYPQIGPANSSVKGDGRSGHSGLWSSLVREKYGLNGGGGGDNSSLNQNASPSEKPK